MDYLLSLNSVPFLVTVHGLNSDYASLHKDGKDDRDIFQLHLANIVSASLTWCSGTSSGATVLTNSG